MEKEWDKFTYELNQKVENRLAPIENQISYQQELISKLSNSLESVLESIQLKTGKKVNRDLVTLSSSASDVKSKDNNIEDLDEEKIDESRVDLNAVSGSGQS